MATLANVLVGVISGTYLFPIANLVFIMALCKWRKWGFYGSLILAVVIFVLNLTNGIGIACSALGLVGLVILFGVLNIGGDRKAWLHLK
jgi:hypothetical protein